MNLMYASRILVMLTVVAGLWSCQTEQSGVTFEGTIEGAENLQVFVDHVVIGKANSVIAREQIGGNGSFNVNFEDGLEPGIYNLRIGAKRISLVVDESPNQHIKVSGNLNTLQNYEVTIEGSEPSQQMADVMRQLIAREMDANGVAQLVEEAQSPMMASYIAFRALGTNGQFLDTQKKAQQKLAAKYPQSEMTTEYANYISAVEQQYAQQMAQQRIKVGAMAPDITMESPDGKTYSLSDLKGKIVLLDFWASWCRPCRLENPNVVKVYNQYKDQGFTIFSVSLDGLDSRMAARLGEDKVQAAMDRSKQAWIKAIEQDNLTWPYHVSDLKKWQSAAAATYGVRSIPRAFMIDREGRIASTSVRGAEQIEAALQDLLTQS